MSFISRLLSMYILINYCHNALCNDSNVESDIDNQEYQRNDNDDYNQDDQQKLFGLDYYNDVAGNSRQEDDEDVDDIQEFIPLKNKNDKDDNDHIKQIVILDTMDTRNYRAELEAGNKADLMGTNPHYYQPNAYPDFSRRFVPQYLYTEVEKKNKDGIMENKLKPQLVPPELVLQVAKESAIHGAKHKPRKDELIRKEILRTGDYWNSVWKEDVDPQALRTNKAINLESVRAEIPPGKLYDLILKLKKISPILYIINEKNSSN